VRGPRMSSAAARAQPTARPSPVEIFIARAEARALLWKTGELELHEAVDELQAAAVASGLVAELGQDEVQAIMAKAFAVVRDDLSTTTVPDPLPELCAENGTELPELVEAEAPDDEDTFARACRAADERARSQPVDPTIARARQLLADKGSLERASRQMHADFFRGRAAARTLMAAEYLVQQNDLEQFRAWLNQHSTAERTAIQKHIREARRCR
jgi:hypothetical protein